jgi:hypothetical protein
MANRKELYGLRRKGHEAGIEGSSKMTAEQLRDALQRTSRGEQPIQAKREAKGR